MLAGVLACGPEHGSPTQPPSDASTEQPAAAVAPIEAPSARRHALLDEAFELHARPGQARPAVQLLRSSCAVEILAERDGWWHVRTLAPDEARALGLPADAASSILELRGWTTAQPQHELDAASPIGASAPPSEGLKRGAETSELALVVPAGASLYWPDGSAAGTALEAHGFVEIGEAKVIGELKLLCHEMHTGGGLGLVMGLLCVDSSVTRRSEQAASEDPRVPALDAVMLPRPEGDGPEGTLDPDEIRDVVRAKICDGKACYEQGLAADPI